MSAELVPLLVNIFNESNKHYLISLNFLDKKVGIFRGTLF